MVLPAFSGFFAKRTAAAVAAPQERCPPKYLLLSPNVVRTGPFLHSRLVRFDRLKTSPKHRDETLRLYLESYVVQVESAGHCVLSQHWACHQFYRDRGNRFALGFA